MPKITNTFYVIDNFVVEKLLSKKVTPFLYVLYVIIALNIVREDIGRVPPLTYLSFVGLGIALLIVGIMGVRDKLWFGYSVQTTKREAHFSGYFALLGAILVLLLLYYRKFIFG